MIKGDLYYFEKQVWKLLLISSDKYEVFNEK